MSAKKIAFLLIRLFSLEVLTSAQIPQVVVFNHTLRWTDEVKFPNYFLQPEIRDSVFNNTKAELMTWLSVTDIKFPDDIQYSFIPGFGKNKSIMPENTTGDNTEIGIFSFITRATVGYGMLWNFKIIIRQNKKILLEKEVSHELEYFTPSGYLELRRWISPEEFRDIFHKLVRETLGFMPAANEKIILGSLESIEKRVQAISPRLKRTLLKINGGWKTGGNFSGLIESGTDTLLNFNFKQKEIIETKTSLKRPLLAALFTAITGFDIQYDEETISELDGVLTFPDNQLFEIKLKSITTRTNSVIGDDNRVTRISNPLTAEIFDQKLPSGYFLYVSLEKVNTTDKTTEKTNAFSGTQKLNTLGIERIHRIKGSLSDRPIFGEFNENQGIVMINSENDLLGVMIAENCNPESRSVSGGKVSKNKTFIAPEGYNSYNIKRTSMENTKKVEWYPFYLDENSTEESREFCIETLVCMFFGIGNMNSTSGSIDN
ncbi:MAG: hypothetical protein WCE64_12960 [Bacteroidales bacterium]